jgi:hypothetical protein
VYIVLMMSPDVPAGGKKVMWKKVGPPAFTCMVQMVEPGVWELHENLAAVVERVLNKK